MAILVERHTFYGTHSFVLQLWHLRNHQSTIDNAFCIHMLTSFTLTQPSYNRRQAHGLCIEHLDIFLYPPSFHCYYGLYIQYTHTHMGFSSFISLTHVRLESVRLAVSLNSEIVQHQFSISFIVQEKWMFCCVFSVSCVVCRFNFCSTHCKSLASIWE